MACSGMLVGKRPLWAPRRRGFSQAMLLQH
jgi:hypothetical protein